MSVQYYFLFPSQKSLSTLYFTALKITTAHGEMKPGAKINQLQLQDRSYRSHITACSMMTMTSRCQFHLRPLVEPFFMNKTSSPPPTTPAFWPFPFGLLLVPPPPQSCKNQLKCLWEIRGKGGRRPNNSFYHPTFCSKAHFMGECAEDEFLIREVCGPSIRDLMGE